MRILVIDNYDSFTYNLVQYIKEINNYPLDVYRNDQIALKDIEFYDTIVLSPGPGVPSEAGLTPSIIKTYGAYKSILGVCLGHQAITEVYGGTIKNLRKVYHGVSTQVFVNEPRDTLFDGLPDAFEAGRYHSWVAVKEGFPKDLRITAEDPEGTIMALSHVSHHVKGVQFHPESILTPNGKTILENFLKEAFERLEKQTARKEEALI